uniref:Amino acid transporter transmembrane domain-containing protein n=1 Tax=Globodera rostochiensis TaxID=31243 RepID=A0A914H4C3_GLORO
MFKPGLDLGTEESNLLGTQCQGFWRHHHNSLTRFFCGDQLGGDQLEIGSFEAHRNRHGINLFVAAFFIVAQMAGGGIVALPTAIIQSGLVPGLTLNVALTLMTVSTSIMLGKCWVLLRRRWPSIYRERHCHQPYPEMCERSLGKKFRCVANIFVLLNQFSIAVVFLLLSSKNIHQFVKVFTGVDISFCLLIIAIAFLLFPATLLKSPEDFGC